MVQLKGKKLKEFNKKSNMILKKTTNALDKLSNEYHTHIYIGQCLYNKDTYKWTTLIMNGD